MFTDLDKLIGYIIGYYPLMNDRWNKSGYSQKINLRKKLIVDMQANPNIMEMVRNYRAFLTEEQPEFVSGLIDLQCKTCKITTRVKQLNSIEYKLDRYVHNDQHHGTVSINKCFNDLFGIRIVLKSQFDHNDLNSFIESNFSDLKLIDSTKNGYKASHIYFKNGNYSFPWELQIWRSDDEISNLLSHKVYKQGYTEWEKRYNEGGV